MRWNRCGGGETHKERMAGGGREGAAAAATAATDERDGEVLSKSGGKERGKNTCYDVAVVSAHISRRRRRLRLRLRLRQLSTIVPILQTVRNTCGSIRLSFSLSFSFSVCIYIFSIYVYTPVAHKVFRFPLSTRAST